MPIYYICMICTKPKGTSVYSFIRTFVESEYDFGKILVWVQSLAVAHSGHASMQWPCWIVLIFWLLRLSVLALHHQFSLPIFPLPPFSLHMYTLLPFCDTDSKGGMGELLGVLTDEYWWFILHDKQKFKKDGQEWKWETPDTPQADRLHKASNLIHLAPDLSWGAWHWHWSV